jgi:hypothetical protein
MATKNKEQLILADRIGMSTNLRCEAGSRVVPRSDRAGRFPEAFFA